MSSFGYACYLFDTQKVACCLLFRSKGNWTIALRECWRPFSFLFLQLDCNIYANACLQFTKKLSLFARIYFLFSTIKQIELARVNNDVVLRRTLFGCWKKWFIFAKTAAHTNKKFTKLQGERCRKKWTKKSKGTLCYCRRVIAVLQIQTAWKHAK